MELKMELSKETEVQPVICLPFQVSNMRPVPLILGEPRETNSTGFLGLEGREEGSRGATSLEPLTSPSANAALLFHAQTVPPPPPSPLRFFHSLVTS